MRDEDKPFVVYQSGPRNFKIVPRGRKGWRLFGVGMALQLAMTGLFVWFAVSYPEGPVHFAGLAAYLLALLASIIGSIRWMKARAEVVDVQALLKLKREAERARDDRRRGR
jgi:hypothetical protein